MDLPPPFAPTVRDGKLYARGACDDKGQVWCHAEAILAWQANGGLPVNLTVLIEGEEEVGSEHLEAFVEKHRADLKADVCVISDTGQLARGVPTITYGLRGLLYAELFLTGPSHDLHSGIYGGAVPNPANALCRLLASLHNPDGTINVPNFYADVIPLTDAERDSWRALPFDEGAMKAELNLSDLAGEAGYSTLERRWARPHLRRQRHHHRLSGRRRENGHPLRRQREGQLPPRAGAGPRADSGGFSSARCATAARRASLCGLSTTAARRA